GRAAEPPGVSIIVAAYSEERPTRARLHSLVQTDSPRERRQIIIASDGSSDGTVALAQQFADAQPGENIRVLDLPRGGKAQALNSAVRSEERRVGKEGRSRRKHHRKKITSNLDR